MNNPKYYRLLEKGEIIKEGDVWGRTLIKTACSNMEYSTGDPCLRPVQTVRICDKSIPTSGRDVIVHADGHVSLPCGNYYSAESIDEFIRVRQQVCQGVEQ